MNDRLTKDFEECIIFCRKYGIEIIAEEIKSKCRNHDIVFHRALMAFWLHRKNHTSAKIGSTMNRDHATMLHSLKYGEKKHIYSKQYSVITAAMTEAIPRTDEGLTIKEVIQIKTSPEKKELLMKLANDDGKVLSDFIMNIVDNHIINEPITA